MSGHTTHKNQSDIFQKRYQLLRSPSPVADGVFHFVAQFGEGLVVAVGLENGVVAEALSAALLLSDLSVTAAFEVLGFAVKVQRDAGAESRLAVSLPFHRGQHLVHIVLIAAMLASITRRIHPWRTT